MESQPSSNVQICPKRSLSGLYEGPLKRPRPLPSIEKANFDSIGISTVTGQASPINLSSTTSPDDKSDVGNRVAISSLLSLCPVQESNFSAVLPGVRDLFNQIPGQESSDVSSSAMLSTRRLSSLPIPRNTTTIPRAQFEKQGQIYKQKHAHHGAPKQKVIPCPYEFCQKTFSRNSNLKVHLRIHTKTYPFACNLCEREFMWSSSLHWHTKWHEKVAMREAAKLKGTKGTKPWTSGASARILDACTCKCLCPVHDKNTAPEQNALRGNEQKSSGPQ